MFPWGARGLYEVPAIEHKACPSMIGGEPPRAIQHPAAQFRIESVLLIPSESGVEVLGFLVVILVDAHLAGVDSRVGFTGAVVGVDVFWRESLDVNESFLRARVREFSEPFPLVGVHRVSRAGLEAKHGFL